MKHSGNVCAAEFSPDGKWLVTASNDGIAQLWAARTGKPVGEPMRFPAGFALASFSPDSKSVVTIAGDARVWDAPTGRPVSGPMGTLVLSANFSPDSRSLVTAGRTARRNSGTHRPANR